MTQRFRIGLVTPAWPGDNTANGITTSVFHLARGLCDIGHAPVILSRQIDGEIPANIPFAQIEMKPWSLTEKLRAKISRSQADAIQYQRRIDALIQSIRSAQKTQGLDIVIVEETQGWAKDVIPEIDVPVVICLHGPWLLHKHLQSWGSEAVDIAREKAEEQAFRAAAGLLSPSRNVLEAIENAYDLGDKPRQVIYNSYQVPEWQSPQSSGPILFIGRYDRHKGGDTVLATFDDLLRTHPEARLSFAGPDRGLTHPDGVTTSLDTDLGALSPLVRERLSVLGQQNSAEIVALRASHPIALIASRYENMNYTLLEAMSAGQAIVSTAVGGPAEVLTDGETALLVPPEDPAAMADALRRLLDDPALLARLGQAAKAKVENVFHPKTIATETVAFCKTVLARQTQL